MKLPTPCKVGKPRVANANTTGEGQWPGGGKMAAEGGRTGSIWELSPGLEKEGAMRSGKKQTTQ